MFEFRHKYSGEVMRLKKGDPLLHVLIGSDSWEDLTPKPEPVKAVEPEPAPKPAPKKPAPKKKAPAKKPAPKKGAK